ncbi:MAG: anaerobic ribonucleoside-triphosphate reductase activating protein [Deltaproteobacteria bacterium]|nr:anaerobic ribonucleoside-triphosphate reductase activating protein [Deltaproteobacteria bacterium]
MRESLPLRRDRGFDVKGFIETSFLDWPGYVSSVLFLGGCNLRCPYCHNHALVTRPGELPSLDLDEILSRMIRFQGWIDGITITGGEPTLHAGLSRLISEFKEKGFRVKLDTNGTKPDVLEKLIKARLVDAISMDVKGPLDSAQYSRCVGIEMDVDVIERSLDLITGSNIEYELRTTVVPTLHGENEILNMAMRLKGCRGWRLQNFRAQDVLAPPLREVKPYSPERIEHFRTISRRWVAHVH